VRLQPNHPTDDLKGIAASTLDGLCYGCGDAVIGINPATDNLDNICRIWRCWTGSFPATPSRPRAAC
jgi:Ethanolamine ammonia-lyase heavy chain (EC 4.3.1.7)